MDVSNRGISQRRGAPSEKISFEIVTISQERRRNP
jgi:hypothetical protein